ncbi:MAG TPA: CoA ester lyase [Streptosporangiaceae bacterium]|nr:CoA ester lyase [Streptosporangiaceae bacterium]
MTRPGPRRSCLTVPGSSERFITKAASLSAGAAGPAPDEVILDLEDSVAPAAKEQARGFVAAAIDGRSRGDQGGRPPWPAPPRGPLIAVRVNDARSPWAYRDVIEVVERAGHRLDAIVLPKVSGPGQIVWLDTLLSQVELAAGLTPGGIAVEAQIEDAAGLAAADQIAVASPRLAALVFGPADFMASLGMRSLSIGSQPGGYAGSDAFHYAHLRILIAARAAGLQAIDGPYAAIGDSAGLGSAATSVAALGYDGKWVVHPDQIGTVNAAFSPSQEEFDRAERILEAYEHAASVDVRGAVMLDGEMIDEATRKLALVAAARGRAAGRTRRLRLRPDEHR